jgi:hypothetical protein
MNDNAVCLMKKRIARQSNRQVRASLDDPRPSIPNEEAKRLMAIKRENLRKG